MFLIVVDMWRRRDFRCVLDSCRYVGEGGISGVFLIVVDMWRRRDFRCVLDSCRYVEKEGFQVCS